VWYRRMFVEYNFSERWKGTFMTLLEVLYPVFSEEIR
jgi:hypothetical protein